MKNYNQYFSLFLLSFAIFLLAVNTVNSSTNRINSEKKEDEKYRSKIDSMLRTMPVIQELKKEHEQSTKVNQWNEPQNLLAEFALIVSIFVFFQTYYQKKVDINNFKTELQSKYKNDWEETKMARKHVGQHFRFIRNLEKGVISMAKVKRIHYNEFDIKGDKIPLAYDINSILNTLEDIARSAIKGSLHTNDVDGFSTNFKYWTNTLQEYLDYTTNIAKESGSDPFRYIKELQDKWQTKDII